MFCVSFAYINNPSSFRDYMPEESLSSSIYVTLFALSFLLIPPKYPFHVLGTVLVLGMALSPTLK